MQKNTHSAERKEISTLTGGVGETVKLEKDPEGRLVAELGGCGEMLEEQEDRLAWAPYHSPEIHNFDIRLVLIC